MFKDNEIIWRRIPDIKAKTIEFLMCKKAKFIELLELYKNNKILRTEVRVDQIEFLANQFIFTFSSWLRASDYMNFKGGKLIFFSDFTARLLLPYLADSEVKEWEVA